MLTCSSTGREHRSGGPVSGPPRPLRASPHPQQGLCPAYTSFNDGLCPAGPPCMRQQRTHGGVLRGGGVAGPRPDSLSRWTSGVRGALSMMRQCSTFTVADGGGHGLGQVRAPRARLPLLAHPRALPLHVPAARPHPEGRAEAMTSEVARHEGDATHVAPGLRGWRMPAQRHEAEVGNHRLLLPALRALEQHLRPVGSFSAVAAVGHGGVPPCPWAGAPTTAFYRSLQ